LIKRGVASLKRKHQERPSTNRSVDKTTAATSVEELVQSEIVILRSLQRSNYAPEINALQNLPGNGSRFEDGKTLVKKIVKLNERMLSTDWIHSLTQWDFFELVAVYAEHPFLQR
jgi:hypothetical protein